MYILSLKGAGRDLLQLKTWPGKQAFAPVLDPPITPCIPDHDYFTIPRSEPACLVGDNVPFINASG